MLAAGAKRPFSVLFLMIDNGGDHRSFSHSSMSLFHTNALYRREKRTLPNGLRVVTVELPHLHSASIVMYAKVGSRYENAHDNGLSHFLEHMLFRGTARLPDAFQINHAIEALGGTLYAETGRDYSLYQISLHPESVREGIALFGEIS